MDIKIVIYLHIEGWIGFEESKEKRDILAMGTFLSGDPAALRGGDGGRYGAYV